MVDLPLWKMMDNSSVGMIIPFPIWWESHKIHVPKPPTSCIRNWVITGLFILVAIMVGSQEKNDNWIVYINNQGYNPIVHI